MRQIDIIGEIKRRSWFDPDSKDPDAAVRVATRRLVEDGEIEKVSNGIYRYKLPPGTPDGATQTARQEALLAENGGDE